MGTKKGDARVGKMKGSRLAYDATPSKMKKKGTSWTDAVKKARKALGITGFKAIKKGTPLYKKAKEMHGK